MRRQVDQNVVDFVADFITDDAEIFVEGHPRAQTSPLPAPPAPPSPGGKKSRPAAKTSTLPAPAAPPPKAPKKRNPLPKPPKYPGSEGDKQEKARQGRIDKQKTAEKSGRNRSPFGDSLERALDEMMTE